jgi:hypothetical protein
LTWQTAVRPLLVAGRGFACVVLVQAVVPTAAKGPVVVCLAVSRRQFRFYGPDRSVAREAATEHAVEYRDISIVAWKTGVIKR